MARQKKPLHHNVTGREYRDARGLAGLSQAAAEDPERYFHGWGVPLRSVGYKPQAGLLGYSTRARKEPRKHPAVISSRGSVCQRKTVRDSESLLKGQCTKFLFQALTLSSRNGRAECIRDS